jgi:hypothetical protein
LCFDGHLLWNVHRQLAAVSYPTAPGVITRSEVIVEHGRNTTYRADLAYAYRVDGIKHRATQYRYGTMNSNDSNAHRIVSDHPVGKEVEVFYNPADPADAVLKTGIEGADLYLAMFLTPFNIIMLGGWCVVWLYLRPAARQAPFGGFAVRNDVDGRVHVRLSQPRLTYAAGTALGLSFVLVFVVGLAAGFNAPLWLMAGIWGIILTGSAVAFCIARPLGGRPRELVLDSQTATLEVYRKSRVVPDRVITASSIKAIRMDRTDRTDGDGLVQRRHVPVLIYADAKRAERREQLGAWTEEQATGLVESLRDWLKRGGHVVGG